MIIGHSFAFVYFPYSLSASQVTDPTSEDFGAGAGPNFQGHQQAARNFKETAGVVEGRPGIIETANIDPLNENSNKGLWGFLHRGESEKHS